MIRLSIVIHFLRRAHSVSAAIVICCLWMGLVSSAIAQTTIVRGKVTAAGNNEPLPYVSVSFISGNDGTHTDDHGDYELVTDKPYIRVRFSYVGYRDEIITIKTGVTQTVHVRLTPKEESLNEVVVLSGKKKYRNRNNPAVDLVRMVIENKGRNSPEGQDYISWKQYEKLKFSLSNTPEQLRKNPLLKRYQFMAANLDTAGQEGKALFTWYIHERFADVFYRKSPEKMKTRVTAEKTINHGEYADRRGLNRYMMHMYRELDIYKENIQLVTNQFLSPVAYTAPAFYRYHITDTIRMGDTAAFVELSFFPRNTADFLFQGKMLVTLDGNYAITRVELAPHDKVNLNWVRRLKMTQDFERQENGRYYKTRIHTLLDFGITRGTTGIVGDRTLLLEDYRINVPYPDSVYEGIAVENTERSNLPDDVFWEQARPEALSESEAYTYVSVDSLQRTKSFRFISDLVNMASSGYKRVVPGVELGPVTTFYSFNPVEGRRLRLGGRTTPLLNKNIYGEGYVAYGLKDQQWKYFAGLVFSFRKTDIFQFPLCTLRVNFHTDTKIPGQNLHSVASDGFFASFKRGVNTRWLYNDVWNVEFMHEFRNNFTYRVRMINWVQAPAGSLSYTRSDEQGGGVVHNLTTSEASLELRWAPREEFYQGRVYRTAIRNKYPVFTVRGVAGIKGVLNSEYDYQQFSVNVYKRTFLSQLGYTDVILDGAYYLGRVPYPLLTIHRANQTYGMMQRAYNLMNFLEFVSDQHAGINVDHCFNGFFFNKVPLVKKLRLREVVTAKVLYGGLRPENDPVRGSGLFNFPVNDAGVPVTYTFSNVPYVEGSVGISNILNFIRVDLVKRFTYLHHPDVSQLGVRISGSFDF